MSSTALNKEVLIKKEFNRLKRIYKDIPDDRKKTVQELMQNAAFLSTTLKGLQDSVLEKGTTVEYQNGENQWGEKQNPDITTYNSLMQRYTQCLQLLLSQLPKQEGVTDDPYDGLRKPT